MPSLSIKRVHFESILDGRKRFEYRSKTAFYESLFRRKPERIRLHYYKRRMLMVDVVQIRTVAASQRLIDLGFTPEVFEIEVRNPRIIREE
jgi:hypothetical protein